MVPPLNSYIPLKELTQRQRVMRRKAEARLQYLLWSGQGLTHRQMVLAVERCPADLTSYGDKISKEAVINILANAFCSMTAVSNETARKAIKTELEHLKPDLETAAMGGGRYAN